jgi:hypothetical protein
MYSGMPTIHDLMISNGHVQLSLKVACSTAIEAFVQHNRCKSYGIPEVNLEEWL